MQGGVFAIKIQRMPEKEAILYLSRTFAEKHDLDASAITVHYGAWNREVKLVIDPALPPDQIGLANGMVRNLTIPSHLPYDVRIDENGLHIGPVIGFIASQSREWITPEKLNHHLRRLSDYENIRGLIFLCSVDEIDLKTRTIRGYYYDPYGPDGPQWVKGRFPYPGAFYKRIRIEQQVYDDLTKVIGPDRVFNRYYFYKLRFWNIMSRVPDAREHLPYTEELTDIRQLDRFLEEYESVFLKPSRGSQGHGIVHVEKLEDRYRFRFMGRKTPSMLTKRQAVDLLNRLKDRKTYLIQQGVQMKYGNNPVDFRVYMQKDSRPQWTCKGMVARIAKEGSIVTNLRYLDRLMYPDEAIQGVFQLNHDEAKRLERHIHEVCCDVCNTLDRLSMGLYGDVAIDLTVDRNKKVWILEINKKYSWKSLRRLGANYLLREIMTGPLEYAKALAGFPEGEDLLQDRSTSAAVLDEDSRMLEGNVAAETDNSAEAPSFADKEKEGLSAEPSAKLENPSDLASEKTHPVSVDLQKGDPHRQRRQSRQQPDEPRPVAVGSGGPVSDRPQRSEESQTVYPLRHLQDRSTSAAVLDEESRMPDRNVAPESDNSAEDPSFADKEKDGLSAEPSAKLEKPSDLACEKTQPVSVDLQKGDPPDRQRRQSHQQPDEPRPVAVGSGGPVSDRLQRSEESRTVYPLRHLRRSEPIAAMRLYRGDGKNRKRRWFRHQPDKPRPVAVGSGGPVSHRPQRSEESQTVSPLRHLRRPEPIAAMRLHRGDGKNRKRRWFRQQPDKPRPVAVGSGGPASHRPHRSEESRTVNSQSSLRHLQHPAPPLIVHESIWVPGGRPGY